jgi:hypothetical protein
MRHDLFLGSVFDLILKALFFIVIYLKFQGCSTQHACARVTTG